MAYVAVSRGALDAQIFTNDREKLPEALGRDVSQQSAHVSHETAIDRRATLEPVEKVYSQAEHQRHWAPLSQAVTPKEAEQFAWRAETGTIQSYQHLETQRALHIDGPSGQFYRQDGNPITAKEALDHAMPKGQEHSHSLDLAKGLQNIDIEPSIRYGHGLSM